LVKFKFFRAGISYVATGENFYAYLKGFTKCLEQQIIGGTGTFFRIVHAAKLNNNAPEAQFSAESISQEIRMVLAPS